jgi:PAS domain S-box-containing protein
VLVGPVGSPHREVVVNGSQILGPDGELLGAVAALSDVTVERTAARALAEERRKLTEAQRLGQLGSFECDLGAGSWTFSDALCELWGLPPGTVSTESFLGLVHEQDAEHFIASWRAGFVGDGNHSYSYRIHRAGDGVERLLRTRLEFERGADGQVTYARGSTLDITELASAQREAERANAFFRAILTASPDYTQVTDLASGAVIYGSPGKELLGLAGADLQARGPGALKQLIEPADREVVQELHEAAASLADGQSIQVRYRGRHVDGGPRWLNHCVTPFRRDDAGAVVEVLAVLRDITDLVDVEERLTYAARHDVLTGLPNRTTLVEALDAALRTSVGDGGEIAVLFCDLDGFKRVNDTDGHSAGDAVLFEAARRLREGVRPGDVVARVGGDEFVILVAPQKSDGAPETGSRQPGRRLDRNAAVKVAERVGESLRRPINVMGIEHTVTASIGITYVVLDEPTAVPTAEEVLHQADAAMYRAKHRGKNRFEVSQRSVPAEIVPTLTVAAPDTARP